MGTTASNTQDSIHTSSTSRSSFQKTVCLQSWWLVKAEENSDERRLAVAGFTSREQQAVRLFSSAPILKRHDVFTLETIDGICVIIKGFMDKARTEANGFPSEVLQHFVFGFPPNWEVYAEKCLGKECTSNVLARSNPKCEKDYLCSETQARESSQRSPTDTKKVTSEKIHGEGQKKNLEVKNSSEMDKMEKSRPKGRETKSSVILPQDSEVSVGRPDGSSHGFYNAKVTCTLDVGSVSSDHLNNKSVRYSAPSRLEGDTVTQSSADDVNITCTGAQIKSVKSSTDHDIKSPTSACHMSKIQEPNSMSKAHQTQNNVRSFLGKQHGSNFILEKNSPDLSHRSGRVLRSSSKLKGVKKGNQLSTTGLEKEKDVSVPISVGSSDKEVQAIANEDSLTRDTSFLNVSDAGDQCLRNEMTPGKPDGRPSTCSLDHFSYIGKNLNQDQNHGEITRVSSLQKDKTVSLSRCSTLVKKKEKVAIGSKTQHASGRKAKRKLAYENLVSEKGDELCPTASPESISFKRSRSGRLLLPTLEFWRNQIAIYDVDRKITGIKEGLHLENPYKGSRSEPALKRRQHK